jgi:hypothetical protein
MAERQERCELCRWWQYYEAFKSRGECHQRPPALVMWDGTTESQWPKTIYSDWCGEFRPRDPRGFPD